MRQAAGGSMVPRRDDSHPLEAVRDLLVRAIDAAVLAGAPVRPGAAASSEWEAPRRRRRPRGVDGAGDSGHRAALVKAEDGPARLGELVDALTPVERIVLSLIHI